MKTLRIVLAVLAGAIVLLAIVAVIIVRSFDLNDYKDEITAFVEARTGRILTIDDNIEFSLFPWFAVETGGVSLSDDPAFGDSSFVTVDSLSARVRVWPLLRRRIEIGRVILDGINVNLGMDEEGRGNWASLSETPAPEAPAAETPEPGRPAISALAVEGIELRNARILWHDVNGEVVYLVRDLSLVTGPVNDDDPVEVTLALSLLDVASQASAAVELQGVATIRLQLELSGLRGSVRLLDAREQERAMTTLELDSLSFGDGVLRTGPAELAATLQRPPIGRDGLGIEARVASMTLDTGSEDLVVDGLAVTAGQTRASLSLTGQAMLSDPRLAGTVDLEGTRLAGLLETLGIDPSGYLGSGARGTADPGGFSANAGFILGLTPLTLTVERYAASLLGVDATGRAAIAADRSLSAAIELAPFRPTAPLIAAVEAHLPDDVDIGAVTTASLRASMTRAPASAGLDIDAFSLGLDNARLTGRLSIETLAGPAGIGGTLEATGLDNRLLSALFGTWLPQQLVDASLGTFRLATDFDYEPATRTAAFAPLELTAYGLAADGQLTIVDSGAALALSGRATIAEFSPRDLLARFDLPVPQTADPTVFRSAEVAASFETRGGNGEFRDIAVELDDSRVTGQLSVENFADPEYRFLLRADHIDADRYLPPRAESAPSAAAAAAAAGAGEKHLGDLRLASEPLTATNLTGSATVGHLRIGGMDFDQLSTEVAFGQGRAALSSVRTELYGGSFAGGLTIDGTGLTGAVHLMGDLRAVALKPMLTAMLGGATLSGTGDIGLDLTGTGDTVNEALATAAGSLRLAFSNGEIDGVNLGRKLCAAVNAQRRLAPPAEAPNATAYSVIRGTATVTEGIASTTDLYATTGYLDLTGRGGIRLVDQWLDTQFQAALTGAIRIAGCEDLNATIANDPIPVNFTLKGQLPDVDVGFDISQLLSDWARREVRSRVREEVQDSILNRIFN